MHKEKLNYFLVEARYFSEVLKAYSEGKEIEYKNDDGDWVSYNKTLFDLNPYRYRVKPEPKYRPYNNGFDFLESLKVHGPYLQIDQNSPFRLPIVIYNNCIEIVNTKYSYKDLSEHAIWQDGTPCRVIIEE